MYTIEAVTDVHDRCHRSLSKLMEHCRKLTQDEFDRTLDGFGYGTVRLQIHHIIGAQKYWLSVVQHCMDADENDADYPTIAALEAFRLEVYTTTQKYLGAASDEVLNSPQEMQIWGGKRPTLVPARVLMRTQTHIFHHMGQITAMCRLLGKPVPSGMDFSLL